MNALLGLGVHNADMYRVTGVAGLGEDPVSMAPDAADYGSYIPPYTGVGTPPVAIDTSSGGSVFDWATFTNALSKLTASATQAYRSVQDPAIVPGSNLVYNPATGQFLPATGSTLMTPFASANLSSSGMWLLIGGGLLLVMMMGGGRK